MNSLLDLISGFGRVCIIGMCKNAGKTAVLNKLISQCGKREIPIGITAVGADEAKAGSGEGSPSVFVSRGTLFTTTKELLKFCDITKEILLSTDINTALGEVVVIRALSSGFLKLSGPSMNADFPEITNFFLENGAEKVLIDGAGARKAVCIPALADGAILCTGVGYDPNMSRVVSDTAHAAGLLCIGRLDDDRIREVIDEHRGHGVVLIDKNGSAAVRELDVDEPRRELSADIYAYFSGALTDRVCETAQTWIEPGREMTFVSDNAAKLMLTRETYEKLKAHGHRVLVLDSVKLACVCVNPKSTAGPDFDGERFLSEMRAAVKIPVIDVCSETGGADGFDQ